MVFVKVVIFWLTVCIDFVLSLLNNVLDVTMEVECRPGDFRCSDGQTCVSRSKWCNRINDCPDASDETDCRT